MKNEKDGNRAKYEQAVDNCVRGYLVYSGNRFVPMFRDLCEQRVERCMRNGNPQETSKNTDKSGPSKRDAVSKLLF